MARAPPGAAAAAGQVSRAAMHHARAMACDEFSRVRFSLGSAVRGLHRYAADAFIVLTLAHLVGEWLLGRFSGFRWCSWVTGVPLIPPAFVCGIGGFLDSARGERRIVVFGCDRGARMETIADAGTLAFSLPCAGMLPPSFVDYALRGGAAGVVIAGCREGACEFRPGQRWTAQRLAGQREPRLRGSVPRERWETVWADAGDEAAVRAAVDALRDGTDASTAAHAAEVPA
jgi:coenzyme F420-reducing hydrogenase delta subunit